MWPDYKTEISKEDTNTKMSEQDKNHKIDNVKFNFLNIFVPVSFLGLFCSLVVYTNTNNQYISAIILLVSGGIIMYTGYTMKKNIDTITNEYNENVSADFYSSEYNNNEIMELANKYPEIGLNTVLVEIKDIYVPKYSKKLIIKTDDPTSDYSKWKFNYPFVWDVDCDDENDENNFPYLADKYGFNKSNFNEMIGMMIPVKYKDDSFSTLIMNRPETVIKNRIKDGDITKEDIDVELIENNYDIDLPSEIPVGEDIIIESNPWENKTNEDWR